MAGRWIIDHLRLHKKQDEVPELQKKALTLVENNVDFEAFKREMHEQHIVTNAGVHEAFLTYVDKNKKEENNNQQTEHTELLHENRLAALLLSKKFRSFLQTASNNNNSDGTNRKGFFLSVGSGFIKSLCRDSIEEDVSHKPLYHRNSGFSLMRTVSSMLWTNMSDKWRVTDNEDNDTHEDNVAPLPEDERSEGKDENNPMPRIDSEWMLSELAVR